MCSGGIGRWLGVQCRSRTACASKGCHRLYLKLEPTTDINVRLKFLSMITEENIRQQSTTVGGRKRTAASCCYGTAGVFTAYASGVSGSDGDERCHATGRV